MSKLDPLARIMTMNSKGHPGRPGKNQTMERRLKRVERESVAAVLAYDLPGQDAVGVYSQLPDPGPDYVGHIALVLGGAGQPGAVYVGNQGSNDAPLWQRVDADEPITFAYQSRFGSSGSGDGQFAGIEGVAANDRFVWVADTNAGRIQKFTHQGVFVAKHGPSATMADSPGAMAYDEANRRVGVCHTDAATDHGFQVWPEDFSARTFQVSASGSGNGQFNIAMGLDADASGNWWVTDLNNHRVQKFNSAGAYQSQFGSNGSADGQFSFPQGICVDGDGNIHVVDTGNRRIQKFTGAGAFILKYGSPGNGPGQFTDGVWQVVYRDPGLILVGDQNQAFVNVFTVNGDYVTRFAADPGGYSRTGAGSTWGIASWGNYVWVADNYTGVNVRIIRATAGAIDNTGLYIPFLLRTRLSDVAADYEWTNQPAALTEMGILRTRRKVDLAHYRDIRFMFEVNQAGVAGSDLLLRYSPDGTTWTTITGTTLAIDSTGTKDSGWVSIPAAARDAVFLAVWGQDGNATADPQFNWIVAQVR